MDSGRSAYPSHMPDRPYRRYHLLHSAEEECRRPENGTELHRHIHVSASDWHRRKEEYSSAPPCRSV